MSQIREFPLRSRFFYRHSRQCHRWAHYAAGANAVSLKKRKRVEESSARPRPAVACARQDYRRAKVKANCVHLGCLLPDADGYDFWLAIE